MSTPRPTWDSDQDADALASVEVDWAALPDDWRTRNFRLRAETRAEQANIIRAQVVEGIIDARHLGFADWLDARDAG